MLGLDSFAEFYGWCEGLAGVNGRQTGPFACNGSLTAEKRLDEVLAAVLSTGRAMRVLNGNKYGILVDKPRDYPVMVLNSQNVLEANTTRVSRKPRTAIPSSSSTRRTGSSPEYIPTGFSTLPIPPNHTVSKSCSLTA
jgi:hypothetical protein